VGRKGRRLLEGRRKGRMLGNLNLKSKKHTKQAQPTKEGSDLSVRKCKKNRRSIT